ncbi:hypothetical protein F2P56_008487 [Juglans regia]|uniref:Uncharacterized protein n=2 Tax=Juglans regia TaxID=51240 RepID=A0A834CV96_JUGRE|nr:uncharacterized protein LOC108988433 [Juglans regia]KAF5471714.1 hypothetical protein F2P56_008487 [Juglans regia]
MMERAVIWVPWERMESCCHLGSVGENGEGLCFWFRGEKMERAACVIPCRGGTWPIYMISLKETTADPSDASSVNAAQIISQVLGSRSGYLRALGHCMKPSSASSSSFRTRSNDDKTK